MCGFVTGVLLLKDRRGAQGEAGQLRPAAGPAATLSSGMLCPSEVSSMLLLISSHLYTMVTLMGKVINKAAVPAPTVLPGVPLLATSPTVDHESY